MTQETGITQGQMAQFNQLAEAALRKEFERFLEHFKLTKEELQYLIESSDPQYTLRCGMQKALYLVWKHHLVPRTGFIELKDRL